MMNICNNHLFGLIIFFVVVVLGIVSVRKEERDE